MSNLDWFQELYEKHRETFYVLLQEAQKNHCTLRVSASPDGTVIFTGTNDEMTKTIVQDSQSITYRQMKENSDEKV